MKKFLLLIVMVFFLFGCEILNWEAEEQPLYDSHRVERHIDREAGVVCWVYTAPIRGGIHCMPIEDTCLGGQ